MEKIDFTYASKAEHNFAQRLLIKTIENITGKRKLEKLYKNYSPGNDGSINFWSDILKIMDIGVKNKSSEPLSFPKKGSLLVIANHPFGIIDGLILCSLISTRRSDFKIITHETLKFLPQLEKYILPVDFSDKKEAKILNIETSKKAITHLKDQGALIIFPAGGVSTAKNLKSAAEDDDWKLFPAKLIHQTKPKILPIYFEGKNGILFHIFATKLKSQTLKYSTYIHETKKKIGKDIIIFSGKVINYKEISHIKDRKKLTEFLKEHIYNLKNSNT